jgi:hypothetical protein
MQGASYRPISDRIEITESFGPFAVPRGSSNLPPVPPKADGLRKTTVVFAHRIQVAILNDLHAPSGMWNPKISQAEHRKPGSVKTERKSGTGSQERRPGQKT